MTNIEKYRNAFIEGMEIPNEQIETAVRGTTPGWDSVGFMSLIAIIEEDFEIELAPEDILNFSSYLEGIKILKKYGVDLGEE